MRRAVATVLLLALLPAGALAARDAPGDGTLSIRAADGTVNLDLRGAVIGKIARGQIVLLDPKDDDCDTPLIWDVDTVRERVVPGNVGQLKLACVYTGLNMRFRLVGGQHQVRLVGRGISLSAVGRGTIFLRGAGGPADGFFAVNSEEYQSMPDEGRRFPLGTAPVTTTTSP